MGAFSSFSNRLPDPNFSIEETGKGGSGTAGPGFASVKFTSNQPVAMSRTNSGRVTTRAISAQNWKIAITYNPMTRDEFEPIYNFLQERRGMLKAFEVVLPQYASPRSTVTSNIKVDVSGSGLAAGATNFMVKDVTSGSLRPGDMFTFNDSNNSNHKKVYQVTRVLTNTDYITGNQPTDANHRVYYITPSVEKTVSDNTPLVYTNPAFRVIQSGNIVEYSLNTNNLYQYSLTLEEAQP
tara:strand:- start:53 stop:766 length:714 start_codon:yes stop_codon:yes gene_type:complete